MSLWRLIKNSLFFYWRTNLGVFLAVALSTAILVGALLVGDSVSYSLKRLVDTRLGRTNIAVASQDFFREKLSDELSKELDVQIAPVLQLRGLIVNSDGTKRVNQVQVLGVDKRFFTIGNAENPFENNPSTTIVLNSALAERLSVEMGNEVVIRIDKPSLMPRDVPLTPDSDLSIVQRTEVSAIVYESGFGRFSLLANQLSPLNVFVPLKWLQQKLERRSYVNLLLVASENNKSITVKKTKEALKKYCQLEDLGLKLRKVDKYNLIEVSSRKIFIDDIFADKALTGGNDSFGILTYFVNELRFGNRTTPYSFVTAIQRGTDDQSIVTYDMQDNEILINQWLADDLGADKGDSIELTYYVMGPMRKLQERKSTFKIRRILAQEEDVLDPGLMPDFPGLSDKENCREWQAGIPINLENIRDKDEQYWDLFKGTPKAVITLSAGQKLWQNRFGKLTSVRYPVSNNTPENIKGSLLRGIDPAAGGLYSQPVRAIGTKASEQTTDFGQLFLGLSIFLIVSAIVLLWLVFVFGVEKRTSHAGILLALGFTNKAIKRLFLFEGAILAVLGTVLGAAGGILYTKGMIYGLRTIWSDAVAGSTIHFYAKPTTVILGSVVGLIISFLAIWLSLRKPLRQTARKLLTGNLPGSLFASKPASRGKTGLWIGLTALISAVGLLVGLRSGKGSVLAGAFFGSGVLLLIAGLSFIQSFLTRTSGSLHKPANTRKGLVIRNVSRRIPRSLAVTGSLAGGIFLIIAIGANRHDPTANSKQRDSGTGGFAIYAESSIGILKDLSSERTKKTLGLDNSEIRTFQAVQLRVKDGDDASCLNLNRAQKPRLLGVDPEQFQQRKAFRFVKKSDTLRSLEGWELLNADLGQDIVPAVGDYATITWALGKSLGDEIGYIDEKGRTFKIRLVGMLQNSIFQGSLIIAAKEFEKRFASEDGYRTVLIDTPEEHVEKVTAMLSERLVDFGIELTTTQDRLIRFNSVESTYLSIFQLLGGLAVILGTTGLGLVVLLNIIDRRGELAMMRAVGFGKDILRGMIIYEHLSLMVFGLLCGIIAALVAVTPAIRTPQADLPYLSVGVIIACILINGLVWICIASWSTLRGDLLDALRSE